MSIHIPQALATINSVPDEALLNALDLERVVAQAGPVPYGLTHQRLLHDTPFGPVKVRIYASPAEARQQADILAHLAGKPGLEGIALPGLLGCWRECLVFAYQELDSSETQAAGQEIAAGIGRLLAVLHTSPGQDESGQGTNRGDLDEEFARWMQRFQQMRMLPAHLARKGLLHYLAERPVELPVRLDYWDAMPHNFGIRQEMVHLLDEKHLRPSFLGVGLVKPLQLLSGELSSQVLLGYQSFASLELFERYRNFLEFYYLAAALYFYSLSGAAGRVSLGRNPRFLEYRQRFIKFATKGSYPEIILGKMHLLLAFPADTLYILKRHNPRQLTASSEA